MIMVLSAQILPHVLLHIIVWKKPAPIFCTRPSQSKAIHAPPGAASVLPLHWAPESYADQLPKQITRNRKMVSTYFPEQ